MVGLADVRGCRDRDRQGVFAEAVGDRARLLVHLLNDEDIARPRVRGVNGFAPPLPPVKRVGLLPAQRALRVIRLTRPQIVVNLAEGTDDTAHPERANALWTHAFGVTSVEVIDPDVDAVGQKKDRRWKRARCRCRLAGRVQFLAERG
jgi:hypothetical protein